MKTTKPRAKRPGHLSDAEFMALADRALDAAEARGARFMGTEASDRMLREAHAMQRANVHLAAYLLDRNPEHVFNACREYAQHNLAMPPIMVRNLDKALRERGRAKRRAPALDSTLLELRILHQVLRAHVSIPERLPARTLQAIAKAHGMTKNAVSVAVHRLRRLIAEPHYNRRSRAR